MSKTIAKAIRKGVLVVSVLAALVALPFLLAIARSTDADSRSWLTQNEQDWIATHLVITVAPDPYFPPIEYFDDNGDYRGMAADYLDLITRETGLKFQVVRCGSWDEALQKVRDREVDALPAAANTPERSSYVSFSDPMIVLPGVIIARQGTNDDLTLRDLAGMNVAVVDGYLWQEFIARDHPDVHVDPVPDVATGLRKVSLGMADAMVATLPVAIYYIEQEGITNLHVAGESGYYSNLSFASRSDWPELNAIVMGAMAHVPQSERDAITQKWIHLETDHHMSRQTLWVIIGIGIGLGLSAIGFVGWTLTLRRQVARRTKALQESEEQFRTVFDSTTDAILIFSVDGRITYANQAACRMYGYGRDELAGMSAEKLIRPDYFHGFSNFQQAIKEKGRFVSHSVNVKKDGAEFDVEVHGAGFTLVNTPYLVSITLDVSERLAAEQALKAAHRKVEHLHETAYRLEECKNEDEVYGIVVDTAEEILDFTLCSLDIVVDDRLVVVATSSQLPSDASQGTSLSEGGLAAKTFESGETLVFGSFSEVPDARPTDTAFQSGISAPIGGFGVFQVVSKEKDAFTRDDARLLDLLLGYASQAIGRIRLQERLRNQAMRDPLTDVYNRRYFNQVIEQELMRSKRYDHPIGFLMMDVDQFKEINDTYGHQTGDKVLRAMAELLVEQVRETDLVVRYGGDEFLLVLLETDGETESLKSRIEAAVNERNRTNHLTPFPVTLSIGSAHWLPDGGRPIGEVLAEADERMYAEKQKRDGRNDELHGQ